MRTCRGTVQQVATVICLTLLLLFPVERAACASGGGRSGELPPGVPQYSAPGVIVKKDGGKMEIYTRDDAATVRDFYRKTLGISPDAMSYFFVGWDVLNQNRPSELDERVGVRILVENNRRVPKERDLFDYLKMVLYMDGSRSEQDLQQVRQEYTHLLRAWYPDYDVKKGLKKCKNSGRSLSSAPGNDRATRKQMERELAAKMQELISQGRYQEAVQLGQQGMPGSGGSDPSTKTPQKQDNWEFWLGCLAEADEHAFATKVEIGLVFDNFRPSTEQERMAYADYAAEEELKRQERRLKAETDKKDAPEVIMGRDVSKQLDELRKMFDDQLKNRQ